VESFHQNYVVIFQTTILRIVGFYVRRSAMDLADTGTFSENLLLMTASYCFKTMLLAKCFFNLMQGFKSAILAIFHFWQNGTFEPLHEIQKTFLPKALF
jgi:hypothetical protein